MIYARVHNRAVAEDYYAAMAEIEKNLDSTVGKDPTDGPINVSERAQLLELVDLLAEPRFGHQARLDLLAQMRRVLDHETPELIHVPANRKMVAASYVQAPIAEP
jgi:hypothetical protein